MCATGETAEDYHVEQ